MENTPTFTNLATASAMVLLGCSPDRKPASNEQKARNQVKEQMISFAGLEVEAVTETL